MKTFRDLSIRSKLVAVIVGTTVLTLSSGFALVAVNDIRTFRRDMVESTRLVAQVVGDACVGGLAFGDRAEAEKTLASLASLASIQGAYLYDASGGLFATYSASGPREFRPPPPEAPVEFRDGALHVSHPVFYKGERYGTLNLRASTRDLDRRIAAYLFTTLGVLVVLSGLAVAAALRLQGPITEPILNLARVARRISEEHDYSLRIEPGGRDEVGALCDGFNEMLGEIHRRELEREAADRRTREKSRFLANMSHELRTPLNSIIGFSEILLGKLADRMNPRELKFLHNINTSGHHLLGIINDILDLSKVEAGKMELHPQAFSVRSLVEGVCQVMKGISSRRNIRLEVDVPDDLPALEADPVKFKQILYNLISNAVKFSPYDAAVTVSARFRPQTEAAIGRDAVEVAVTDQGPGIDPKDHQLIFQEFRQAEGGTLTLEGTGLGLTLVRKFAELHGGGVAVRSALGQGATLLVTIPLKPAPPAHLAPTDKDRPQVVVVHEDAEAYEAVRRQITHRYAPLWARSAEEALRLARTTSPAAITLDLAAPGLDGWRLLKTLKSDAATRGIPVLIVSTDSSGGAALTLAADDCFLKPFDQAHLLSRVRSIVPPARPEGVRLLVVDDEPHVHELLDEWLGSQGYRLEHALSGPEGIERALASPPDLVILDLLMDDVDGFEVALRLKADRRTAHLPILVLTAKDLNDRDRLRLRGRIATLMSKSEATEGRLVAAIERLVTSRVTQAGPPPS